MNQFNYEVDVYVTLDVSGFRSGLPFAPDMFPLTRQVQIATDFAKGTTARLAGAEVPKYADDETSFAELKQRITKTVRFVESLQVCRYRRLGEPRH